MLNGTNTNGVFDQEGRKLSRHGIVAVGRNSGLLGQIGANEIAATVGGCRLQGAGDELATVEANALEDNGLGKGVLHHWGGVKKEVGISLRSPACSRVAYTAISSWRRRSSSRSRA